MKKEQVSLAIPTMQVQELNNEFNTPLDMVKVVVERHKPYHSADITVEQRAFQVTEKAQIDRERKQERLVVFREKLHKRVVAEQKRLTEAKKKIEENNKKAEERLIAYRLAEKQRLSVPPPPKPLVKKTPKKKKQQQDNSKLKERIEEHILASQLARTSLAKFKNSHGASRTSSTMNATQINNRASSKFTFLERQRYREALMQQMDQKFKELGLQVPPICSCHNTASPLDPMYTYFCANNCPLFRNEDQQLYLLRAYLSAHEPKQ
ncbi:hypothetical protein HOP50_05g40200 [Chloropicon primus]|uniref:Uncharacterized protein n=1 Tax=Chloropicon primus TaxID=1764295 RepID=A0A5B8MN75_9CHLO|nr:hypothetical protein A3770_05p40120 [Chloropicon primus]UPR00704.1 hypothetical protein HOP50_05g40200 [Chloropicon primus]|eukprot:QDZ21494.1 hypothetical protein A3770_05p40120 [Chloropicon primus]